MLQIYQEAQPADYTKMAFDQYFHSAGNAKGFNTNVEYIMYGDFNRLEINLVDSFRKFRDISEYSRKWLGRRQSVLLYEIDEKDKRLAYIQEKNGAAGFVEFEKNYESEEYKLQKHNFLVFSMLSFTNEVINCITDFKEFIKSVRQHILSIVNEAKSKTKADSENPISVKCEVFGSFNTSEIALFFLCDQYVDALRMIEFIRRIYIKVGLPNEERICKVFFNSFSFVSKNRYQENGSDTIEGYHIKAEEDIKGKAVFQISLKGGGSKQVLEDIFCELHKPISEVESKQKKRTMKEEAERTLDFGAVGEQDLITIIPAGRAMMYFQKKKGQADNNMGMLSFEKKKQEKEKYWKHQVKINIRLVYESRDSIFDEILTDMEKDYLQMRTEKGILPYKKENIRQIPQLSIPEIILDKNKRVVKLSEPIYNTYEVIRKKMKQFAQSVGAIDTLDLLYTDYLSMISYAYNAIWGLDFQHQFHTILKVIKSILDNENKDWNWESYRDLINNFKQQIYHLSQSNRAFLEIPTCHTRYTGQQDYLLHAYFGIVKKILQIVYLTHKHNQQSELVPLITVDVVPIVESTLYYEGKDSTECRVINLNIPNAIMFDFPRGVAYLIHEIYHYVSPYDRANRNQVFTCIMLTEIRLRQVVRILKRMFDSETEKLALKEKEKECVKKVATLVTECFRDVIWGYLSNQYDKIREVLGDSETEPLIFSRLLLEIGKYAHKKEDQNCGIEAIFELCLSEFAEKSKGFEYHGLCSYLEFDDKKLCDYLKIDAEADAKEGIDYLAAVKIWLDILKYYYIDNTELAFFLKRFENDLIFSYDVLEGDYKEIAQDVEWVHKRMWHGINEAVRDIAMIKILEMELAEYLIFVIQCWEDLNLKLKENPLNEQQICRLGSIFQYYESFKEEQEDGLSEVYLQQQHTLFIKRYLMIHYKTESFQLSKIYQDAETYWKKMYATKEGYLLRYSYYDSYIQQNLFFYTDIQKTIQVQRETGKEMVKELTFLCKEFRVQVTEKYNRANRNFMEIFNIPEDVSGTCITLSENHKKKYELYKKEIFACNLSIAHYYQKQNPIQELHHKYDHYQSQLEIKNPKERRIVINGDKNE